MKAIPCGKCLLISLYICLYVMRDSVAIHRVDTVAGVAPDNHPSVIDQDAIHKLSEIFDIPTLKSARHFPLDGNSTRHSLPRSRQDEVSGQPPQYMLNLYQTIADSDGVMRIPNPYHANLIKSFDNKEIGENDKVMFDVKSLQESGQERESLLQAEMHLDLSINLPALLANYSAGEQTGKDEDEEEDEEVDAVTCGHLLLKVHLREKSSLGQLVRGRLVAHKELYLDQCLQRHPLWTTLSQGLDHQRLVHNTSQVLAIGDAVQHWTVFPQHNHGLEVDVSVVMPSSWIKARPNASHISPLFPFGLRPWYPTSRSAAALQASPTNVPFKISKEHPGPVLILFMDDGRPGRNPKYRITDSAKQQEFLKRRLGRLGQSELFRSYSEAADFEWNEQDSTDVNSVRARSRRSRTSSPFSTQTIFMTGGPNPKYKRMKGPSSKFPKHVRKGKGRKRQHTQDGQCRRHQLYISFEEIGWDNWIISPKGFQAFHCRGTCNFPIGEWSKPSNHATVLSIISHLKLRKNVAPPCCVPEKLYSIGLLFYDSDKNVILKQYDDMVAQSCACR